MKILVVLGTRPEAIKFAPLVAELRKSPQDFSVEICSTGQHREMLRPLLQFFGLSVDHDLNLMQPGQSSFSFCSKSLAALEGVFANQPDVTLVQGDTATAFIGALGAFFNKQSRVGHVEAGLRSHNKFSPYPEEIFRRLVAPIADYHFCPTEKASANLRQEGIREGVHVTGNTSIDALHLGLKILGEKGFEEKLREEFSFLHPKRRTLLVTGHRRESFGRPFEEICLALRDLTERFEDVEIVYPVHLNPQVQEPVKRLLSGSERIHLIAPLEYPKLLWLMSKCFLVLTDSGGIQEEAPSLGKPVLVMREVTERGEGVESGNARLVGTDRQKIVTEAERLLRVPEAYAQMSQAKNPYGDGQASRRIAEILRQRR